MTNNSQKQEAQTEKTIYINQIEPKSNGLGTAGFVLSLIAIFLCWVPGLNWVLWVLGLIFSLVGIFKQPRGLAIAGLVISLIGVILLVAFMGALLAAFAF